MTFLATLASMSFFKRSGTYNLDCLGKVEYTNDVKRLTEKCRKSHKQKPQPTPDNRGKRKSDTD